MTSWRTGRVFGVPVDLHWTCAVIPLLIGVFTWENGVGPDWGKVGWWSGMTVLLFAFVLAHELGHALVARRQGVAAERIVLFPLGGGAYLPEQPPTVRAEVLIYGAGPAVNLLIAALALPVLLALPQGEYLIRFYLNPGSNLVVSPGLPALLLGITLVVNVVLALGNLLPAYPLDGGRILRALLRRPLGARPATVVVTVSGVLTGLLMIYLSYRIGDPLLAIGAGMVALLSVMEFRNGWQRRRLDTYTVDDVLRPVNPERLYAGSTVGAATALFESSGAPVLPVFSDWNELAGFVSREVLLEEAKTPTQLLQPFYEAEYATARPGENLLTVTERVVDADVYGAAVCGDRGRILGYVYTEDVIRLLDTPLRRIRQRFTPRRARP